MPRAARAPRARRPRCAARAPRRRRRTRDDTPGHQRRPRSRAVPSPPRRPAAHLKRDLSLLLLIPPHAEPAGGPRPAARGPMTRRRNLSHARSPTAARRGPVGPRPVRAAQRHRAAQAGRPRPSRQGADHHPLRPRGIRLHRPGRPAGPVPLVGPVHPAAPRRPRGPHRLAGRRAGRGLVLHDAHPGSGRPAHRWPGPGRRLEEAGLSTVQACGDVARNILGCPVAGIDAAEVLDATPALRATEAVAAGNPDFANLPRKYKTAISGCAAQCTLHEVNDVSFVGVAGPGGQPGFDLWAGGGLSTNPMIAARLGAFVRPDQVAAVWAGVTGLFRDYGYRRLRSRARLKFLVADWGPERVREVLEREYLGAPLPDGPAPAPRPAGTRDHVGVHRQRDGRYYVGVAPHVGRTSGSQLWQVAGLAGRYGSGRLRTTTRQQLLLLDVGERDVPELVAELEAIDLPPDPPALRRGAMACTGLEFCKLAITETKQRARDLYGELARRLPGFDAPVAIHVNGCPNSCARFQLADIGLKGMIVDGEEGFQVHLGGSLGAEPGFGRKVRGLRLTGRELPGYVERLLRAYLAHRADGEDFAAWARRADEGLLR